MCICFVNPRLEVLLNRVHNKEEPYEGQMRAICIGTTVTLAGLALTIMAIIKNVNENGFLLDKSSQTNIEKCKGTTDPVTVHAVEVENITATGAMFFGIGAFVGTVYRCKDPNYANVRARFMGLKTII